MDTNIQTFDKSLEIIGESKVCLSDFLSYLKDSPLADMYRLDLSDPPPMEPSTEDIEKVCTSLEQLLLQDLSADQLIALYVASSQTYLMSSNHLDFNSRIELLHKTFRYASSLDPVFLHLAAKRLHENLKSTTHLLVLGNEICHCGDLGIAIALCLAWATLLESLDKAITMYCLHPFSLINELLAGVDVNKMLRAEKPLKAYFVIQSISFLINHILRKPNDAFKSAGYSEYFRYEMKDIEDLRDWIRATDQQINICVQNSNTNFDLTMVIKEEIAYYIVPRLEKILSNSN